MSEATKAPSFRPRVLVITGTPALAQSVLDTLADLACYQPASGLLAHQAAMAGLRARRHIKGELPLMDHPTKRDVDLAIGAIAACAAEAARSAARLAFKAVPALKEEA